MVVGGELQNRENKQHRSSNNRTHRKNRLETKIVKFVYLLCTGVKVKEMSGDQES